MTDFAAEKAAARKVASKARSLAHAQLKETAGLDLARHGATFLANRTPGIVSGFFPYQSEIDSRPLLGALADAGWTTALPVVVKEGTPLEFRTWRPGEPTVPGAWDIPVPEESVETVEPDVMFVPLLAFDDAGYRLGYGGGFYDRTIARLRGWKGVTAIGVAYSGQWCKAVPHDAHDEPLDVMMTEEGVSELAGALQAVDTAP
ncbi:MAG: 5-formyltetrahydrofolate cyclo-ligase [Hyphomicrobiales bacterium]